MAYKALWDDAALAELFSLPHDIAKGIKTKVETYLICDPKGLSKTLTATYKGRRSYRYGDYRIIFTLDEQNQVIEVIKIGHRKNIYLKL